MARLVIVSITLVDLEVTVEVKGHVYWEINEEINEETYDHPDFGWLTMYAQSVRTRPFLLPSKGLGTRLDIDVSFQNS